MAGIISRLLIAIVALVGAAAAPTVVHGQQTQQEKRLPVNRETTATKLGYVRHLVAESTSARTLAESGDADARAALARARELVAEAEASLAAGDIGRADAQLNEAVGLVTSHTRRLSKSDLDARRDRRRYETLRGSVIALRDALERVADEDRVGAGVAGQETAIARALEEAEAAERAGRIDEAIAKLEAAYRVATRSIANLREGRTVVARLEFDTPEDEYRYEIDRHDAHRYLLTLALSENAPHPSFMKNIAELRAQSDELRAKAEQLAAAGDYDKAIRTLEQATDRLITAIRMAGIYIP